MHYCCSCQIEEAKYEWYSQGTFRGWRGERARLSDLMIYSSILLLLDFGFKITMGSARQNLSSFVQWSKDNPKVRLPKRAKHDLSKDYSHGGSHFYVKDEKSLTLVKMFLGSYITKIETVIRS